ncbi:exopolyphosphatase-like enzyme [Salinarchaeum sp. Harcht-Bsk1]|uniref:DHH family phosphoesterase n=1 Tax=Salinarchaeum sp. Harcht-Bsk1 TaxID=1333523 RepID=UPI0003423C9A|nr:DHH family phosphoesterase [Salinarchaeum sp. Harcht-Bsk1]AGN02043.1 exopolyphosphatase-like enzyme [Salinarchaeum sp. Harcht-Bsk1]
MPTRVVLGCGPEYRVLLARLAAAGDLLVVVDDGAEAKWLTERDVPVVEADPTDPDVLRGLDLAPESVVVATGTPDETSRIAAAAREVFPNARLLSQPSVQREDGETAAAAGTTDPAGVVADRVLEYVASEAGHRALELRQTLRETEQPIAVLTHDNPDPDAIASAVALVEIAAAVGVEAEVCYFGTIAHQENRALVNLLDLDLRELEELDELEEYGGLALVDHARPGVNDQLPDGTHVDVVIDHHPTHGPDEAGFVDLRSGVGSTSTLLTEYFDRLGVELTEPVATALLYGLRVDTDDFTREVSGADFEAAATLVPNVDTSVLERVESPSVSEETMEVLAWAIERRQRHGAALTACVGELSDRDALAQAADRLLDLEGISTTLVFGIIDDTVFVSGRARGAGIDLGATLRSAFGQLGSAGGHADMAGAQLPVGMLVEADDSDPVAIVEEVLTNAFLEALETSRSTAAGGYALAGDGLSFLPDVRMDAPRLPELDDTGD